jgi:hypothetical protein
MAQLQLNDALTKVSRGGGHAPVVCFCILGIEFYGTGCKIGHPVSQKQYNRVKIQKLLTGIMQRITILLEVDACICTIAE